MTLKILLFITIPIIIFSAYTILSYIKIPFEYDSKLIRRIYYILVITWIALFSIVFYNKIKDFTILKLNGSTQSKLNVILFIFILFIFSIIWDYIFISCKTLKNLKLKDTEFTIEEINNVKYIEKIQEKEKETLYCVLNGKIKMLKYIDYYMNQNIEMEPCSMYLNIISEYQNKRKGIKVYTYYNNEDGINRMQKEIKLTLEQLSSILYSIQLFGFCRPQEFRKNNYIFSKIKTKYIEEDIILVLKSDLLIDKEHIILIEIISYFEQKLDVEILKMDN